MSYSASLLSVKMLVASFLSSFFSPLLFRMTMMQGVDMSLMNKPNHNQLATL